MASVRFADVQARPMEGLDWTSWTLDAFQRLGPPCEAAFQAPRAAGRLEGNPRTARQVSGYNNGPLPTPEARLCFLLVSLTTSALQVGQGRFCGRGQSTANQGSHGLPPAR